MLRDFKCMYVGYFTCTEKQTWRLRLTGKNERKKEKLRESVAFNMNEWFWIVSVSRDVEESKIRRRKGSARKNEDTQEEEEYNKTSLIMVWFRAIKYMIQMSRIFTQYSHSPFGLLVYVCVRSFHLYSHTHSIHTEIDFCHRFSSLPIFINSNIYIERAIVYESNWNIERNEWTFGNSEW